MGREPLRFISSLSPRGVRIEGTRRCEVRAVVAVGVGGSRRTSILCLCCVLYSSVSSLCVFVCAPRISFSESNIYESVKCNG